MLLVGAALLYVVGMNVFLRTRLFRDLVGEDPRTIAVEYSSAYTLWPGRIHADDLVVRGSDSNVEWILRIDRCDVEISLQELAHKKFHANHIRGDGVSFRVRRRVDQVTPATMSALPPISGFLDPPLKAVGPPDPPLSDAKYGLFSIELEDVVVSHVREVWVDTVRYSGELGIRGRWWFRPLRWLDVAATVDASPLDVSFGRVEPWASGLVGRVDVIVHPFDLVAVPSGEIVDQVSIEAQLSGVALVANVANRATAGRGGEVIEAEAPFELRAGIDHGVVLAGTHLRTERFAFRGSAEGFLVDASIQGDVRVGNDGVGYADLRVADAGLSASGKSRAQVAFLAATLASQELDLARHPLSEAVYAVEVEDAETQSLAYWMSRLPRSPETLRALSGTLSAGGRIDGDLRRKTGRGRLTFGARGLDLVLGKNAVRGNVTGVLRVDGSLEEKRVDLSGSTVSFRDMHASVKGVSLDAATMEASARGVTVGTAGATGRISMEVPAIEVPSLPAAGALIALPKGVAIEAGRASVSARVGVDLATLEGDGQLAVAAPNLRLRLGARRLEGALSVALTARQRGAVMDLSGGQLAFQSDGAPGTLDWWGRVQLRQGALTLSRGLRFRSSISAAAKDASPLTALIADHTALPQWLMDAVSTKGFEATGQLLLTPSVFAVRSVQAHAEGANVDFELGKIRADTEWVLLLDLGAPVAGVDVASGKTQVVLFGARPWFQRRAAALEAAERRSE